jgi:hypothetical protein
MVARQPKSAQLIAQCTQFKMQLHAEGWRKNRLVNKVEQRQ